MATPKKKHLIELMIEAGVKWPEGAEYAAQDKCDNKVYFFNDKPKVYAGETHYRANHGPVGRPSLLPSLCRNWHQTIVTRERYTEALAAIGGKTNQVRESEDVPSSRPADKYCASVMRQMPSETIESLLAEIKAKREECDALVEKAEALALEIASIEQQVNDKLKEYGFTMSPLATPSEQPVITDWRDLRVGDVIWVGESNVGSNAPAGEYSIVETEIDKCMSGSKAFLQPVGICCHHIHMGVQWPNLQYRQWRFIRRP